MVWCCYDTINAGDAEDDCVEHEESPAVCQPIDATSDKDEAIHRSRGGDPPKAVADVKKPHAALAVASVMVVVLALLMHVSGALNWMAINRDEWALQMPLVND